MHRFLLLALIAGCSPITYAWTPASAKATHPRPENCKFEVYTSTPQDAYEELGTLVHYNGGMPKTVDKFKDAVGKQVCDAGGDGVIAQMDDKGEFSKGTVIHKTAPMAEPVKALAPEKEPPAQDTEQPLKKK